MNECYNCGFWDSDYEACTCPSQDLWYAGACSHPTEEDFRDHGFLEEVNNNEHDRTTEEI